MNEGTTKISWLGKGDVVSTCRKVNTSKLKSCCREIVQKLKRWFVAFLLLLGCDIPWTGQRGSITYKWTGTGTLEIVHTTALGVVFRDSLRQQMKILPQPRNWQKASMLYMVLFLSLFYLWKEKPRKMHQICVNEGMPKGWPVLLYDLMKENLWPYIYIHIHTYIYIPNQQRDFVYIANKYYFFFKMSCVW